ncbi:TonB-dependent receptor [Flagellimonas halotolerans]|uniref:TonB-dependent receptor n=1 Tax=Flagellimonas halotolerans TaxID=3112164 RepID=A0ABU6IP23_9FLAO|nr:MULTISPECIES: TonB-dependent receptor [unclassified Allomuricauda]MEC3964779.1 TonB-dependent receptor [Muricauda sp. SYSU M86414]MEC4264857.1 TonB-dependent receptor [Muricauda sp. SYSU M84420]
MKKLMFLSLMLLGLATYGQTTVQGKVVDENNDPIPGANVVLVGKAEGTTTDFDGNFTFNTDEEPPFQLQFSSIGFSDFTANVTSNNQTLTITLSEANTMLDEIVISASRTPERIFESPVSVERFGLREIKNTTAESFYGGLQNLKGVDINTNSLTFQSVNTRGFATFANNRFLQLVDGMDNTAPGLNFVLGNLVGMSELDVQSVEILPGASSALYGAGAFNGILFMTSKNPFDFQGISAYAKGGVTTQDAAGSNFYKDFGVRAAHAFSDKVAVKANLSVLTGEDWHANSREDLNNPGADRSNPAYDGLNVYGDEVSTVLDFDAAAGLPSGTVGSALVSRTGYDEADLADYGAESVKADFALHYRPFADDLEVILNSRIGRGTTIYQGANRYAVAGFTMQQHKLEIKNDNFFLRGYIVSENSGDAYDTRFAAINVNRLWKRDAPNPDDPTERSWFGDYAGRYIPTFLGLVQQGTSREDASVQAHAAARAYADEGRLIPGTAAFQNAFNKVINDGDLTTGAKFIDKTKFRHVNGNYNIAHLIDDWADIQIGGSFREYELNSNGTIFTDIDGPIKYNEYGAYLQVQKKFLDDRLKFTGSARYDKNEFFDGFLSPRLSLAYTLGEERNHNLRVSVQQGFRNPTTQDLFIGLNAGRAILVGSAPSNLDRDVRTFNISQKAQDDLGQPATVEIVGREAYENAYSVSSLQAGAPEAVNTPLVKPEEIIAYEAGYRGQVGKFTIDLSGYYNSYSDFLANTTTAVPFYGEAGDGGLSLLALQNGDYQVYQTYTNSEADINSYGGTVGVDTKLGNFDLGVNYTFAELDIDEGKYPDLRTNFNTPKHKVKASFGNAALFKNFGFNVNYRWSDSYYWEASFADGNIPAYTVLDAQINYSVPSIKSVFKLGGSNLLGDEYYTAIGTGFIGSIYYLSWSINP